MQTSSLSIVWLITGQEQYGLRRAIINLASQLARNGCQVTIAALAKGECVEAIEEEGLEVRVLNLPAPPRFSGSPWAKARAWVKSRSYVRQYAPQLADQLREFSPDVLHWTGPVFTMVAPPAAKLLGALAVWEVPNVMGAGSRTLGSRLLAHHCAKHQVLVLANSAYTAASLARPRLTPKVFHLGVDADVFNPECVPPRRRDEFNLPDDAIVLGIVARLDSSKGQRMVLEVLQRLQPTNRNMHLLLVGGRNSEDYCIGLERFARQHELAGRLHMVGATSEPQRYYELMDVAINARLDAEPFGLSVIEAMMMGRPVAVHALGGPAETVIDGETGWHIHSPGVEAWQAGISRVLADRDRWQEMGQAARQHALANFTTVRQAERYLSLLKPHLSK